MKALKKLVAYQRQFAPVITRGRDYLICTKRYRVKSVTDSLLAWIWEESDKPALFAANPWGTQRIRHTGWRDVVARNETIA